MGQLSYRGLAFKVTQQIETQFKAPETNPNREKKQDNRMEMNMYKIRGIKIKQKLNSVYTKPI